MTFRTMMRSFVCLCPIALSACGYWDSREAHRAQYEMVGMTSYDLQACAGVPNSSKKLNDTTEIWEYDISRPNVNSASTPSMSVFPINMTEVTNIYQNIFGKGGSACRMFVRVDHDRISEIHYAGDNDEFIGEDGICSMITRGCARQRESTMRDAPGIWPMGPISAFHSVPTETQSPEATYSDKSSKFAPNYDHKPSEPLIQPIPKDGKVSVAPRNNGLLYIQQGKNGLPVLNNTK